METKPAPMPLLVVQSFVNTWEGDSGVDLLADPVAGPRWLEQAGLAHGPDVDLAQAREIRESIRALLVQNGDGETRTRPTCAPCGPRRPAPACSRPSRDDGSVDVQPDEDDGRRPGGHAAPHHPRRAARRLVGHG